MKQEDIMKQKLIAKLLEEASESLERAKEVYGELSLEVKKFSDQNHGYDISHVFGSVFWQTLNRDPTKLIQLFPFVAVVCGDRETENNFMADIDWTAISDSAITE
jgi:hypothetical protein